MNVTRAWIWLMTLSVAVTLAAASGMGGRALAAVVLPIAWIKAQIILNRYLGLAQAPAIARGFALALGVFMLLLIGLAIAPPPLAGGIAP